MYDTDASFDFVQTIKQQKIFQNVFNLIGTKGAVNRLALRHNKDLFLVLSSNVRCCTINSKSSNYYLLVGKQQFVIQTIRLNNSGTFLAALGSREVEVFTLPANINSSASNIIASKTYSLSGLNGNILKAVWQSSMASDSSLVVLDDQNTIYVYNVLVSESPVAVLNLNSYANFENETAVSISFGSDLNLSGSLTLYIATKSSKVFAIYPFVRAGDRIVATRDQVLNACSETLDLMQALNTEFPSLTDDAHSKKVYEQLRFYVYLKKQLEDRINLVEARYDGAGLPVHSYKLDHYSMESEETLQGPLTTLNVTSLSDINCISSNSELSILALTSSGTEPFTISYLAQLKPLVMNNDLNQVPGLPEPEQPKELVVKDKDYHKPAVGFGYIDDDSSDEEEEPASTVAFVAPETLKARYWIDNLIGITTIAVDEIPKASIRTSATVGAGSYLSRFVVSSPEATLIVDTSSWLSQLSMGIASDSIKIHNGYQIVSGSRAASLVLMKDDITFTGVYGLKFIYDLYDDSFEQSTDSAASLEVIQIEDGGNSPQVVTLKKEKRLVPKDTTPVHDAIIEELILRIRVLNTNKPDSFQLDPRASQLDKIELVNKFSVESIETIGGFTEVLVKLAMKLSTGLVTLKKQVELVKKLQNTTIEVGSQEKLAKLKEKQIKLSTRLRSIHETLIEKLEVLKIKRQTPISLAEKRWFKEINEVTEKLDKRMMGQLEDLRGQVKHIQEGLKDINTSEDAPIIHTKDVSRIKGMLETQGKSIDQIKSRMETLAKQIH